MEKQNEITATPYQFLLKINDNIVCQRYFNLNNYNKDFRESYEVIEMLDEIMGMGNSYELGIIPDFFKSKCVSKSWDTYNPAFYQDRVKFKDIYEIEDNFNFDVLINDEVVASTSFSANLFQYSVRRNIDIRDIIPEIVRVISYYMELKNYTKTYGGIKLSRNNDFDKSGLVIKDDFDGRGY